MERIEINVRQGGGTYSVSHKGVRVSCTTGAEQAAQRLAAKLWGDGAHQVDRVTGRAKADVYPFAITRVAEPTRCPRTMELPL